MFMTWLHSDSLIVQVRLLEQLKKLAEHARMPCTDAQIIQKGLSLTRATRDFEYALSQWGEKPEADKNWPNFKTHFHEAQLQSKDMRGPTMQQAGCHHANSLAQKINSNIRHQLS